MKVFIGWDKKDILAYEVCAASLCAHASIDLEIIPLHDWKLRQERLYYRSHIVDINGQMIDRSDRSKFSTDFSFTRFLVPAINKYRDEWVLFTDADMMWRADIAELVELIDNNYNVMCVKQVHAPFESHKMYGMEQTKYRRKNWSSFMLLNTKRCGLTIYAANNMSGDWLHSMQWCLDDKIGSLPNEWNYLVGYTDPSTVPNPKVVHFTLGTPDMTDVTEYELEWRKWAAKTVMYGAGTYVRTIMDENV